MRIAITAGTPQLARAARELGVQTVLVYDTARPRPDIPVDLMLGADLADSGAVHAVLAPLHDAVPFDRVLSLTEPGLLPAAAAAERLGVGGNRLRTVRLLQDKHAMRTLLNSRGLSPVATSTPASPQALREFCQQVGGPVILKPAGGSGSHAVVRVDTPLDAGSAWRLFTESGGVDPIAEEFLSGPEVSVEAFSHRGAHTVIAITDKQTQGHFVEVGHTMPSALAAGERAEVSSLVRAFLDAVGLLEGPSHTEVKLTPHGARIIESHNRIGGDKIRELVRMAYGIDLVALTVGAPLGLLEPPSREPAPLGGAAIRFLTPSPGVVREVGLPAEPPEHARICVEVRAGDRVNPVRRSQDRAGYILASGTTAADAARRCDQVRELVRIETG